MELQGQLNAAGLHEMTQMRNSDIMGAIAASSDSEPMAACGTRMPSRARKPQPSGCHMHASRHIEMEYVRSARLAGDAGSIAGTVRDRNAPPS